MPSSTVKAPPKRTARAAPGSAALEAAPGEHILLEGDEGFEERGKGPMTEQRRFELRDELRGQTTRLVLYTEGFLRVDVRRRGKRIRAHRLDLRYLDPMPLIERTRATRWLKAALFLAVGAAGSAAVARIAPALADFPALRIYALTAVALFAVAALLAVAGYVYRTRETVTFLTQHGRAPVLNLTAGLGRIRRCRALLPELSSAIEDVVEHVGDDTRTFLRREMREHYRLRGDGVLSEEDCADSTGRILAQFDVDF